jgi:hypothetical protein
LVFLNRRIRNESLKIKKIELRGVKKEQRVLDSEIKIIKGELLSSKRISRNPKRVVNPRAITTLELSFNKTDKRHLKLLERTSIHALLLIEQMGSVTGSDKFLISYHPSLVSSIQCNWRSTWLTESADTVKMIESSMLIETKSNNMLGRVESLEIEICSLWIV